MELTRVIHPIGQGGFYTETLKNRDGDEFNVVYDCGGNSKTSMENYLERFIYDNAHRRKKRIDAVFISHLHADHVNGLKYLLENAYPRYLFLPQLTDDMVFEVLLHNTQSDRRNEKEVNGLITDLYGEGREYYFETRVIKVSSTDGEARVNLEEDNETIDLSGRGFSWPSIKSGSKIHFGTPWLYIPYNPPVKPRKAESFYEFIKKELKISCDFGWADLPNIVKKTSTQKLREVYSRYFGGNHNAYSMTLFSGLREPMCYHTYYHNYHQLCYNDCPCFDRKPYFTPNCLYTGDFEAKGFASYLRTFYESIWDTISSVQIPHHGSRDNYHPDLYDAAIKGFISVGEKNKYHHPSLDTLISIHRQGCFPMVVTEDLSTMIVQAFDF